MVPEGASVESDDVAGCRRSEAGICELTGLKSWKTGLGRGVGQVSARDMVGASEG